MKQYLILFFFSFFCSATYANTKVISALEEGGKLIFIRHAYAPGGGDPKNFDITRCSSQRNLDATGIKQSKRIGKFFRDNKISIDLVFSSEWCRCKDTAFYAFGEFKEFSALNSIFSTPYNNNETRQVKEIKDYLMKWKGEGKNLILVTHYSIITTITNAAPSSGEVVIADKNLNVIGTIKTN